MSKKQIQLFTDGGADPNPGKGGIGVILKYGQHIKEYYQGYELTTNNRMELTAIVFGLKQLKETVKVEVYSDSRYVVDAINQGWVTKWRDNNWFRNRKAKAMNIDLWKLLLELTAKHEVSFHWVKGHNDHEENERCDQLATQGINSKSLLKDLGYLDLLENGNVSGKIENEGDPCRKCNTPVVKKSRNPQKIKAKHKHFYKYYLICPKCQTIYYSDKDKVEVNEKGPSLF